MKKFKLWKIDSIKIQIKLIGVAATLAAERLKNENDVEYISVNCMDIINGYSVIIARDEKTAKVIYDAVGYEFKDLKAKTDELVSRKEIVNVVRKTYKKNL